MRQGKGISPIFSVPGTTTKIFRRDWLHAADQGVGADFMGNFLKVLITVTPGASNKQRRSNLWTRIRAWYAAKDVKDKLVGLRCAGIQTKKQPPKLKSSAAACRALIPFADEAAHDSLDPTKPAHAAIQHAARALHECYRCLSQDHAEWRVVLPRESKKFCLGYKALRLHSSNKDWKVKPKMHQFVEMCSGHSKPNMSWTYRDEDYGGSIAQLCRIKGGKWMKVSSYCSKALILFKTRNKIPRIV